MIYTKELLEVTPLQDLRNIGKEIGVKSPTSLRKDVLIQNILDVQENRIQPYFSNKGRKKLVSRITGKSIIELFNLSATTTEIDEIFEKIIDKFLAEFKERILQLYKEIIEK